MEKVTVTIQLTMDEINALQKAPLYLEHYGSHELNEHLKEMWKKIGKAALSAVK